VTGSGELLRMVKFSKQFEGQLVPEWKEAFVDYWQLKEDLKKIHLLNNNSNHPIKHSHHNSLSSNILSSLKEFSLFGHQHKDHEAIHVYIPLSTRNTCISSLMWIDNN